MPPLSLLQLGKPYTCAMKAHSPRPIVPTKVDIGAFIESQTPLEGQSSLTDLPRLLAGLAPEIDPADMQPATWRVQGELVPQRVGAPQTWLVLEAQASLPWACQRCLQPVELPMQVSCKLRFVADEATAAALDADSDHDVLVLGRGFDLIALIEDELIMASPIVPFHDECPEMPIMSASDPGVDEALPQDVEADAEDSSASGKKTNPFAALAQLKVRKSGDSSGE